MRKKVTRDEWGISLYEYRELYNFALQYHDKKKDADALLTLRISTPAPEQTASGEGVFLPHGRGGISDPVAATAERRERLLADVSMIEKAALLAGRDLAPWLLRIVTEEKSFRAVMSDCPASDAVMYRRRRAFFFILKGLKDENDLENS